MRHLPDSEVSYQDTIMFLFFMLAAVILYKKLTELISLLPEFSYQYEVVHFSPRSILPKKLIQTWALTRSDFFFTSIFSVEILRRENTLFISTLGQIIFDYQGSSYIYENENQYRLFCLNNYVPNGNPTQILRRTNPHSFS